MAGDANPEGPELPPDARLESLDERLRRAQEQEALRENKPAGDPNYRAGQLVLSHLVGAPFGGFVIGFALDRWLGTKPWLMLVMLFLGFAVGVMNVIRISKTPPGSGPGGRL
ncbi:MAG TPA: AtpZ/AtpI family protein [Sphingomicrobium sp.]|nr:AtpZ/AtpI family protein [Sphingomicrobium sp.]